MQPSHLFEATDSTSDVERLVEPWKRELENLLRQWAISWKQKSNCHANVSEQYNKWQTILALPCVALPLVFTPLTSTTSQSSCTDPHELQLQNLLTVVGFVSCSVFSAINAYFRWGELAVSHNDASWRYGKLVTECEELLATERRFRPQAETTLRTLKVRGDDLLATAPLLPQKLRESILPGGLGG